MPEYNERAEQYNPKKEELDRVIIGLSKFLSNLPELEYRNTIKRLKELERI